MRKIIIFPLLGFSIFLMAFFFVYVRYIYPDDERIARYTPQYMDQGSTRWRIEKLFFKDKIPHRIDVLAEQYSKVLLEVKDKLPKDTLIESTRFSIDQQFYVPVGVYPFRLDGRDALFLPPGSSLVIYPNLVGQSRLQLGLWSPDQNADLIVSRNGLTDRDEIKFFQPKNPIQTHSRWFELVEKWFRVDPQVHIDLPGWVDREIGYTLTSEDKIIFSCKSNGGACFVSEPAFYKIEDTTQKNIILVLIDTLRSDGITDAVAPNIAKFSKQSVVFENALAPGNMTSPSTNGLLACRMPTELGGWAFSYGVSKDEREKIYRNKRDSFPKKFTDAGYETAMIGSVSVLSEVFGVGIHHGFRRQIAIETDGFDTAQITREAQTWLSLNKHRKFFLYLHLNAPHGPYKAPLRDIFETWPGVVGLTSDSNFLKWLYQAEVHYSDRYFGRLFESIRGLELEKNTMVVVVADHGDQMLPRDFIDNEVGPNFSGAYFDHGATLLNDEIKVPLVIGGSGESAKIVKDYVSTLDLGKTLLDVSGILTGENFCQGESLRPYLNGRSVGVEAARILGSEGFQGRAIVFDNRYKYIRSYEPTDKKIHKPGSYVPVRTLFFAKEQLFDLVEDPMETKNLIKKNSSLARVAREKYQVFFKIEHGYELVIENPYLEDLKGELPSEGRCQTVEGEVHFTRAGDKNHFLAKRQNRVLFSCSKIKADEIKINIGSNRLPIHKTSMRLPVKSIELSVLPSETSGPDSLIPYPSIASAYIRKVEDPDRHERKIRVTNPAFESVLREWGYLNDK